MKFGYDFITRIVDLYQFGPNRQRNKKDRLSVNLSAPGYPAYPFGLTATKLEIHGKTVPVHLERIAPHRSNFQPIHLGGHSGRLHANHTTGHFDPLGLLCLPLLRFSFLLECLAPPRSYFSFMIHRAEWKTEPDENPNCSTTPLQLSSDFRIDDEFWNDAFQMAWNRLSVNVQLSENTTGVNTCEGECEKQQNSAVETFTKGIGDGGG
ncbi:hypothetical protein AVEN_69893-1 [Araneus ventricosus]|uniref:Uncharacterized protein n=1 Tax=Araneus ventricosus TaxID=182803 RepID=A0A4Y2WRM2_ARAVE|nr:hypothetical protein AVEN_69893-1 [Araneus ventricosus]